MIGAVHLNRWPPSGQWLEAVSEGIETDLTARKNAVLEDDHLPLQGIWSLSAAARTTTANTVEAKTT